MTFDPANSSVMPNFDGSIGTAGLEALGTAAPAAAGSAGASLFGAGASMLAGAGPWGAVAAAVAAIAQTTNSSAVNQDVDFVHSGWNVNFGSGSITSKADKTATPAGASATNWIGIAAALIALALIARAYKKG